MHNFIESFTGTGAIALPPTTFCHQPEPQKRKRRKGKLETNHMAKRQGTTLTEWLPPFKGAGYNPGEHQMPKPGGKGVATREPTSDSVGSYDTDTTSHGKEWPRDHNETAAMCDVDDDGVENKPQGSHESTHAEATDGVSDKVGHDWPDQPKISGQGVAEPFGGSRWSDGGVLDGQGPQADSWTHEEGPGMPNDGPITGTSGPQLGQPTNESWSPARFAKMMGEEVDLQRLFNSYAHDATAVCVEDFQNLCEAHGIAAILDESSLMQLMDQNQEFVFSEQLDADGPYWVGEPISESCCGECGCDPCECDPQKKKVEECNDDRMGPKKRKRRLNEMQIRSPEEETSPLDDLGDEFGGGPSRGASDPYSDELDAIDTMDGLGRMGSGGLDDLGPDGGLGRGLGDLGGMGPGGVGGEMECPGCGYTGAEEECPECGMEMMDPFNDMEGFADRDPVGIEDDPLGDLGEHSRQNPPRPSGIGESRVIESSPQIIESLKHFLTSATSIIEKNPRARRSDIAEALNHSWHYYARDVDARTCNARIKHTLNGLMNKFPGFNPVLENDAMGSAGGTALTGGDGPKTNLPKQPTEMTTHGDKSLLGRAQKNNLEGTPTIANTGKGMTGHSVNEQKGVATVTAQRNIQRLTNYIRQQLAEGINIPRGNYALQFSILVSEAKKLPDFIKNKVDKGKGKEGKSDKKSTKKGSVPPQFEKTRTSKRDNLAEAMADAEEILQLHPAENVTFEVAYLGPQGNVAMKQDIPLFTIVPRGPIVREGKAVFRFQRTASAFANQLATEGVSSRIEPHNWGISVRAQTNYDTASRVFAMISENKDWIKDAVNPDHRGFCTPMTKSTCTPKRKALAKRFKSGDLHHGD